MKITGVGRTAGTIYSCQNHSHKDWEIVIVLKGSGRLRANGEILEFSENTVYAVPPKTSHQSVSGEGFQDYYFRVDDLPLPKDHVTLLTPIGNDFIDLADISYRAYCKSGEGYSTAFAALSDAVVALLQDAAAESRKFRFTADIRDYLNKEFGNPALDADHLSKKFGYHYDYMRRCFKKDYGVTPMQYLFTFRMREASRMLKSRQAYSVETLSEYCGFSDRFYFSKCFKKQYGLAPQQYRKKEGIKRD